MFFPRTVLLTILAALLLAAGMPRPNRAVAAEPAAPLPAELRYVPADAALFIHADADKLWNSPVVRSIRAADAKSVDELAATTKKMFGTSPDALKSITLFWPKLKNPDDPPSLGVVLVFKAPYDKARLKAGLEQLVYKGTQTSLETPSDTIAVWLQGLEAKDYGKPQPADKAGPLAAAIREAGAGRHLLVAGSTLAQLPEIIRRDDLPAEARAFQPLFQAETITGIIDLGKELSVDIRVKAPTPPRAKEAEKALGLLAELLQEFLEKGRKELTGDMGQDAAFKDVLTIMKALQASLKDAKFSTDGETARAVARMSTDLPIASAFIAGKRKVREAAARAQSSNNLKQIVLSLHNYADTHGSMPPAAVCDKTGKPMLSWRVLILPFIEQNDLYKQFKLDEPWDSENNKKLIAKMPRTYALPMPTTAKANETHYRLFVGNGAAFDYLKGPRLPADFPDGTSNTIVVVTAKDAVPWTKPDELTFNPDKDMKALLGYFFSGTCTIALGDGSVRALSKSIKKETLNAAITSNGGEVLGDDF
jgi:hypothetical protein